MSDFRYVSTVLDQRNADVLSSSFSARRAEIWDIDGIAIIGLIEGNAGVPKRSDLSYASIR